MGSPWAWRSWRMASRDRPRPADDGRIRDFISSGLTNSSWLWYVMVMVNHGSLGMLSS